MDILTLKAEARRAAKLRRKAARAAKPDADERARDVFLATVSLSPGEVVAGYRPIQSELDPTPLMTALHARGVTLCVPVIEGAGLPLSFRVWTPDAVMEIGAFGAEIPKDAPSLRPTLLITPLLAYDDAPYRLGYGGGFYDRTLEMLRAERPTRAYGYAYREQWMENVPIEATDQLLDGMITV